MQILQKDCQRRQAYNYEAQKKKKTEKTQINKNHKGKWEITTSSTEIKGIIK